MRKAARIFEQSLGEKVRVLGPHQPDTRRTRASLEAASAVAGISADDVDLVKYWLATKTLGECLAVLQAAEARPRGERAASERARLAAAGNSNASWHQCILVESELVRDTALLIPLTDDQREPAKDTCAPLNRDNESGMPPEPPESLSRTRPGHR